jgi:hypothetical protein
VTPFATEELVAEHKAGLLDAARFFDDPAGSLDAASLRHLRVAARALSIAKRPRTLLASLALVADQPLYDAPADLVAVKVSDWGTAQLHRDPWNMPRGPLPSLRRIELAGVAKLQLTPSPSAAQIAAFGATYNLYYQASHLIPDAGDTPITAREIDLLLLRAKAEAMRELAIRNHSKPVTLRDGGGLSQPRNGTPAALYEAFLREFNEAP